MKRFCCWILILCMVCSFSAAMAEDEWTCKNCGSEALGNFCSNCGAAKPEGEMWQCPVCGEYATGGSCANCEANGLNGDMLTYYYARSVYQDLDIPYLTNFMRWRDGAEETSALAVFVRDPGSDEVGMFTDAGIVSDGCDYTWQCGENRYSVTLGSLNAVEGGPQIVSFTPDDGDAMAAMLESTDIPYAAAPHDGEELTLCYYVLDKAAEALRKPPARSQWIAIRTSANTRRFFSPSKAKTEASRPAARTTCTTASAGRL